MELLIIIAILIITIILIRIVYKINIKQIKQIGENSKKLDEIVKRYPSNIEICRSILKELNNEKVRIQEDKEANNCLYIAVLDKILIANMRDSFTRIQTIAHECLHSVQDKRILLFNFIYSCFYLIFFYVLFLLGIFKMLPNKMLFISIYVILSYIYFFVRSYLENDAMIKARFLAKDYMEAVNISTKDEIQEIIQEYDKLNSKTIFKTIILCLIFLIR